MKLKSNSVRMRLFYSFALVFFCFILILGIITVSVSKSIKEQINEKNLMISDSINERISSYIKEIEYISSLFYLTEAGYYITEALTVNPQSYTYSFTKDKVLNPYRLMKSVSRISGNIDGIIFLDVEGHVYLSDNFMLSRTPQEVVASDLYVHTMNAYGKLCLFSLKYDEWLYNSSANIVSSPQYICISRKLINTYSSQKIGMLMLLIPLDKFIELFIDIDLINANDHLLVYDNAHELIYQSQTGRIDAGSIDQEPNTTSYNPGFETQQFPILNTGWSFYVLTSIPATFRPLYIVVYSSLAYTLFFIISAILITTTFSKSISLSSREIMKFTVFVKKGNLDYRLERARLYEFDMAFSALNNMAEQLSDTIKKNLILKLASQKAEIKALQAQINPHFMYNTLNAISGCARTKRTDNMISMINALSDILRYSLGSADKMVTLEEELTHVDNYMLIQNIRFNHTIDYIKVVDPDLQSMSISPLMLQPIVENAINHGPLQIYCQTVLYKSMDLAKNDAIIISINDNGTGIDPEKLSCLQQKLEREDDLFQSVENGDIGLGLLNVHSRIRLQYGSPYGLKIESDKKRGNESQHHDPSIPNANQN